MKIRLIGLLIIGLISLVEYSGYAQSQTSMTMEAGDSYAKADKELNLVYQKILKEYAAHPHFVQKLKTVQRLWVQLRDAELAVRYPDSGSYGSSEHQSESLYLENLTQERTKFLRVWLTGIPEGNVCNGSVKMKP